MFYDLFIKYKNIVKVVLLVLFVVGLAIASIPADRYLLSFENYNLDTQKSADSLHGLVAHIPDRELDIAQQLIVMKKSFYNDQTIWQILFLFLFVFLILLVPLDKFQFESRLKVSLSLFVIGLVLLYVELVYTRLCAVGSVKPIESLRIGIILTRLANGYLPGFFGAYRLFLHNDVALCDKAYIFFSHFYLPCFVFLKRTVFSIFVFDIVFSIAHLSLLLYLVNKYFERYVAFFAGLLFVFSSPFFVGFQSAFLFSHINIGVFILVNLLVTLEGIQQKGRGRNGFFIAFAFMSCLSLFFHPDYLPFLIALSVVWGLAFYRKRPKNVMPLILFSLGIASIFLYSLCSNSLFFASVLLSDINKALSLISLKRLVFSLVYMIKYHWVNLFVSEYINAYILMFLFFLETVCMLFVPYRSPEKHRVRSILFFLIVAYFFCFISLFFLVRSHDLFCILPFIYIFIAQGLSFDVENRYLAFQRRKVVLVAVLILFFCTLNSKICFWKIPKDYLFKRKAYVCSSLGIPFLDFNNYYAIDHNASLKVSNVWLGNFVMNNDVIQDFKKVIDFSRNKTFFENCINTLSIRESVIELIPYSRSASELSMDIKSLLSVLKNSAIDDLYKHAFYEGIAYDYVVNGSYQDISLFMNNEIDKAVPYRFRGYFYVLWAERLSRVEPLELNSLIYEYQDKDSPWLNEILYGFSAHDPEGAKQLLNDSENGIPYGVFVDYDCSKYERFTRMMESLFQGEKDHDFDRCFSRNELGFYSSLFFFGVFDKQFDKWGDLIGDDFIQGFIDGIKYRYAKDAALKDRLIADVRESFSSNL